MLLESIERLRALPRLVEISRTFARFGLHDLVQSAGLHKLIGEAERVVGWAPEPSMAARPLPERFRLALEALGPAFVKLGQVLASRVDLLGEEWIASLDLLHDHATPVPFDALEAQLIADLGAPVEERFANFDRNAAAAGSVAQVHRAVLRTGEVVAVKVRRPGVQAVIDADLVLLETLAELSEEEQPALRRLHPVELVHQLRRSLAREVDFGAEARSQQRFADSFAGSPDIVIPKVYPQYTRASLMVMEWIDGIPATEMARVDGAGLDRHALAAHGADAMLQMVLVDGMFHADPHPGNNFFLPGNRIGLIDFGMVGWLSVKRREELIDLLAAVSSRDAEATRDVLLEWTDSYQVSAERFAEDLGRLLHLYEHASLREVRLGALLTEIGGVMREHHMHLPADLALLFKAIITLEGLGTRLVPHFRLIEHLTPFVRQLLIDRWQPRQVAGRLSGSVRGWSRAARAAPRLLEAFARRFTDQGVAVRIEVREIEVFSRHLEQSVNRLAVAFVTAALIVGSSILIGVARSDAVLGAWILGGLGILIAFLNSVWLLASIRRWHRVR